MAKRLPDPRRIEVVEEAVAEVLRRKTPTERIAMGLEANELARLIIEGALRSAHPEWDGARIMQGVARRMAGEAG